MFNLISLTSAIIAGKTTARTTLALRPRSIATRATRTRTFGATPTRTTGTTFASATKATITARRTRATAFAAIFARRAFIASKFGVAIGIIGCILRPRGEEQFLQVKVRFRIDAHIKQQPST
jgi:hypothetical protein